MKITFNVDEEKKTVSVTNTEEGYDLIWDLKPSMVPLFNYVLVEKDAQKDVSVGGILIPESVQEKPSSGVVIAVGNGYNTETGIFVPVSLCAGDRVLFPRNVGQPVKELGENLVILKETDVMGILK